VQAQLVFRRKHWSGRRGQVLLWVVKALEGLARAHHEALARFDRGDGQAAANDELHWLALLCLLGPFWGLTGGCRLLFRTGHGLEELNDGPLDLAVGHGFRECCTTRAIGLYTEKLFVYFSGSGRLNKEVRSVVQIVQKPFCHLKRSEIVPLLSPDKQLWAPRRKKAHAS
jgi:hypothetical protein